MLIALLSIMTIGLSTSAQATTTIIYSADFGANPAFWAPSVFSPAVVTSYTDFWGTTVTVYKKNPKQIMFENGIAACGLSALLGIKGLADMCVGVGSLVKKSSPDNNGLLPLGVLEVTGAALLGVIGYAAIQSVLQQA